MEMDEIDQSSSSWYCDLSDSVKSYVILEQAWERKELCTYIGCSEVEQMVEDLKDIVRIQGEQDDLKEPYVEADEARRVQTKEEGT